MATIAPIAEGKSIQYDLETRDYEMRLDGLLIGYAATYAAAETTLDALRYEWLRRDAVAMADDAAEQDALNAERLSAERRTTGRTSDTSSPISATPFNRSAFCALRLEEELCKACDGSHDIQRCPQIAARLMQD